jgi:hypothetical protein
VFSTTALKSDNLINSIAIIERNRAETTKKKKLETVTVTPADPRGGARGLCKLQQNQISCRMQDWISGTAWANFLHPSVALVFGVTGPGTDENLPLFSNFGQHN